MSDFEHLDYYELLGVSRSASFDEIKRAYRREISKFHPDRFVNAPPDDQAYASERSQRLTEAYAILSDFAARNAYNRGQPAERGARPPRPSTPPQQRDYQAELYDQAISHLGAGRQLQAIGALRQLQQINPFYRNSAELLAQIEAQLNHREERPPRRFRPLVIAGAITGGIVLVALAAWAIGFGRSTLASRLPASTAAPAAALATAAPTSAPEPTAPPTAAPTSAPEPTAPPTAAPTSAPEPTAPPTVPSGQVLLADGFNDSGWATLSGPSWQVGYQGGRYRVQGDAGSGAIWSYRVAPASDVSIGVDMQVLSGEGGLLLRFLDANNYLSVVLNPSQTSYRVEQQRGGALNALAGGQSEAINAGADASNRLVVRVRGDALQVFVNGQQLADVVATSAPDAARYGLLVIAKDTASEALFDNLEIRAAE